MRDDPVLIMMQPRSGSSMVAEIFHRHGLWVGEVGCDRGYTTWENEKLRVGLRRMTTSSNNPPLEMRDLTYKFSGEHVRRLFQVVVPPNTDWMYKTPVDRWYVLRPVFPKARYVFVLRPTESVFASLLEKVGTFKKTEAQIWEHVVARHVFIEEASARYGIPIVRTQDVIDGDLTTLEDALQECGFIMDPEIVARVVDKTKWRH